MMQIHTITRLAELVEKYNPRRVFVDRDSFCKLCLDVHPSWYGTDPLEGPYFKYDSTVRVYIKNYEPPKPPKGILDLTGNEPELREE